MSQRKVIMFFMFKIVIELLKNIIYDNSKEGDFKDKNFNPKKFSIFIFTLALILYSTTISIRVYRMATEIRAFRQEQNFYYCRFIQKCDKIAPEVYSRLNSEFEQKKKNVLKLREGK